jgi:hypothetical protein
MATNLETRILRLARKLSERYPRQSPGLEGLAAAVRNLHQVLGSFGAAVPLAERLAAATLTPEDLHALALLDSDKAARMCGTAADLVRMVARIEENDGPGPAMDARTGNV